MRPPASGVDPTRNYNVTWLDKGWPLTRFLGYRPPPDAPAAVRHWAAGLEHVLPAPWRERHRRDQRDQRDQQLRTEQHEATTYGVSKDGRRNGAAAGIESASDRGEKGRGGVEQDRSPSIRDRVKHKLWEMWLTMIGCFFGIAFSALSESTQRAGAIPAADSPPFFLVARARFPHAEPWNLTPGDSDRLEGAVLASAGRTADCRRVWGRSRPLVSGPAWQVGSRSEQDRGAETCATRKPDCPDTQHTSLR